MQIEMGHRPRMPYTQAVIMETQRLSNIIPINVQVRPPRDAQVEANVWANPTEATRSVQSSARLVRAFLRLTAAAPLPLGRAGVPAHLEATPPCLRPKKEPSLRTRRGLALTYL